MKSFKLIAALIVLALIAGGAYYLFGSYSDGYRAGTVIKLSRKGLLLKTYEGQLNLGMVLGDHGSAQVSNIWEFSVDSKDAATIAGLDSAMLSGRRAKLHYKEIFANVPWRGDTKFMVYKVETLQ